MFSLPNLSSFNATVDNYFHSNFILFTCTCTHNLWKDKRANSPETFIGKTQDTSQRGLLPPVYSHHVIFARARACLHCFLIIHPSQCSTFFHFPCLQISWRHGILIGDNWSISSKHWGLTESPGPCEEIQDSFGSRISDTGFRIFCQRNLDFGFQLLVGSRYLVLYSGFQSPGFRIP